MSDAIAAGRTNPQSTEQQRQEAQEELRRKVAEANKQSTNNPRGRVGGGVR